MCEVKVEEMRHVNESGHFVFYFHVKSQSPR